METGIAALVAQIDKAATKLTAIVQESGASSAELGIVELALELNALTASAVQLSVHRARAAGHTWQELGDLLGVTRQAAFQRFRSRYSHSGELGDA
jgi:hypothetical protein